MTTVQDLIEDLALPRGEGVHRCRSCGASAWSVDVQSREASCCACGSRFMLDCESAELPRPIVDPGPTSEGDPP